MWKIQSYFSANTTLCVQDFLSVYVLMVAVFVLLQPFFIFFNICMHFVTLK